MTDDLIGNRLAERALVGALMLTSPRRAAPFVAVLTADDFTDPRVRLAYTAVAALVAEGVDPDPVAVDGRLRRDGALGCFTNASPGVWLIGLVELPIVAGSAGHYAHIVVEHSWRRRIAETGTRLAQAAGTASTDGLRELMTREMAAVADVAARLDRLTNPQLRPVRESA